MTTDITTVKFFCENCDSPMPIVERINRERMYFVCPYCEKGWMVELKWTSMEG